jgi:hypothetical protein
MLQLTFYHIAQDIKIAMRMIGYLIAGLLYIIVDYTEIAPRHILGIPIAVVAKSSA